MNQYLLITFTAGEIIWLKCVLASADLIVFSVQYSHPVSQGWQLFCCSVNISSQSSACVIYWAQRLLLLWQKMCPANSMGQNCRWTESSFEGVEQHLPSKTEKVDPYKRKTDTFRILYLSRCVMYWIRFSVSFKLIIWVTENIFCKYIFNYLKGK